MSKRLFRSSRDKIFGGVCGGLAEYFNVDVSFVRILTALAIFMTAFTGLIIYIVAIFIVPMDTASTNNYDNYNNKNYNMKDRNIIFLGGALVVIGGFSLLKIIFNISSGFLFACVLILAGGAILYKNRGDKNE